MPASLMVWTSRMLEALARGNDGRKWHTLIDKVYSPKNLSQAFESVTSRKRAAGVDGVTPQAMAQQRERFLPLIERLLREEKYQPKPVKRVWIDKPGSREKRPLGIPTVRDRIVQKALLTVIEPIFEIDFLPHSYGFRPGRGAQQASACVEALLNDGKTWVVDADIKGYFDNIPQDKLLEEVARKIADTRVLGLLQAFLKQGVMESMKGWNPTETGTPQGAIISPLLANIYLHPLDEMAAREGWSMTRYADDFILQFATEAEARAALEKVREWMESVGLTLHPEKTRVVDATQRGGFEFLGWHYERGWKWPRAKSVAKFKDSIREKTPRGAGKSMAAIIRRVNRTIRGWGGYFKGGVRWVAVKLVKWIRRRLRSIQRRRDGRTGNGRGFDHHRYMNWWFAERGLILLTTITHGAASGPAERRR
jgi:RNA-directed DNA polymerase